MSIVALESGELRYVTEKGHVLERDCVAYVQTVPPYAPECLPIAVKIKELEQQRVSLYSENSRKERRNFVPKSADDKL